MRRVQNRYKDTIQKNAALSQQSQQIQKNTQTPLSNFGPKSAQNWYHGQILPLQEDDNLEVEEIEENRIPSMETVGLKVSSTHNQDSVQALAFYEQNMKKITNLEIHLKYLRSILTREYNQDKCDFISEMLMKYFIKTPKFSSAGKHSSFYSEHLGKTITQGGTIKFTGATGPTIINNSNDGILYLI